MNCPVCPKDARGRDDYLDSLKFYLIWVVILGHILWEYYNESHAVNCLLFFIYTFHMPLFVYLSGYFSKKMDTKKFRWFLIRTLETLVLFQTVCVLMKYMGGGKNYIEFDSFSIFSLLVLVKSYSMEEHYTDDPNTMA